MIQNRLFCTVLHKSLWVLNYYDLAVLMSTQNFCLNGELTQNSLILLIPVLSVVLLCLTKFSFNQIRHSILRFLTGLENERGHFKQIFHISC